MAASDYAEAGIQKAASAACGSAWGPIGAKACGTAVDHLLSTGCTPKGGTLWCVEECSGWCSRGLCSDRRAIPPIRLSDRDDYQKRMMLVQTQMGTMTGRNCCTGTYCQLPGQPPPSERTNIRFWDALSSGPSGLPTAGTKLTMVTPSVATGYPSGSIATLNEKTGLWRIAVPIGSGLGVPSTSYDTPWATPSPPVWYAAHRTSWHAINVADRPYRATVGLSGSGVTHYEIKTDAMSPQNAEPVSNDDYDKRTGTKPFYKRTWFIAATIGVALAAAGGAAYFIRSR